MLYQSNTQIKQNNVSPKPFIKWVGGKTQLLDDLSQKIPQGFSETITTYIEPFVGGGAFLFWILERYNTLKTVIINDANKSLINVYHTVRDNPENLINYLQQIKHEYLSLRSDLERSEYYYKIRSEFNKKTDDKTVWAANFIFLNRTCFNGLYRVNSKGLFNVPHGQYKNPSIFDPEIILADSRVLSNVKIMNVDFSEAVKLQDEKTFVYFDPPYRPLSTTSSFCSYCEGGFDDAEQKRLASCCRELDKRGVKWLLSNSDPKGLCPEDTFFDVLYEGFCISNVQASRMLNANPNKRGKLNELLICNCRNEN